MLYIYKGGEKNDHVMLFALILDSSSTLDFSNLVSSRQSFKRQGQSYIQLKQLKMDIKGSLKGFFPLPEKEM